MESSLSVLRRSRLERLRDVGCLYIIPGVESWRAYSDKAATGPAVSGREKLDRVVEHFKLIHAYVPGLQAGFMFGLDVDEGDEPVELTMEFMTQAPFVWPIVGVPTPFGETPFYDRYLAEGRILTSMPFAFYYGPYLVTTLKNYGPVAYYEKLVEMFSHMTSGNMLVKRLQTTSGRIRLAHLARTVGFRGMLGTLRRFVELMNTDRQFRAFHEGESPTLPEFYHRQYERSLGRYAALMPREDRQPVHNSPGHTR
jgi:hypothetical protein